MRVWSLGSSFFYLSLRFSNLLGRGVVLLVKGECESQFARAGGTTVTTKHHQIAR